MTSTSITTVGGVVVVTQVIPKEESGIPLQNAAADAQQAPPPVQQAPPIAPPSKMDDMTAIFMQGQPHSLGVVQIVIGILCIFFSLTAIFSQILMVHAPLCLAVAFVVSGSVAVAAARRTSVGLVWLSLVLNLVSVLLGLGAVAYLCWLLVEPPPSQRFCDTETSSGFLVPDQEKIKCRQKMRLLNVCVYGLLGLLLVLLVLQVCVAVTVCVSSGRFLRRRCRYVPLMVHVQDGDAQPSGAASKFGSDVSLLDSEAEKTSPSPPNSP